jgi:hypothetical protein
MRSITGRNSDPFPGQANLGDKQQARKITQTNKKLTQSYKKMQQTTAKMHQPERRSNETGERFRGQRIKDMGRFLRRRTMFIENAPPPKPYR